MQKSLNPVSINVITLRRPARDGGVRDKGVQPGKQAFLMVHFFAPCYRFVMQIELDNFDTDTAFAVQNDGLIEALRLLSEQESVDLAAAFAAVPIDLPDKGTGERELLCDLAALVLGGAHRLDDALSFAHRVWQLGVG